MAERAHTNISGDQDEINYAPINVRCDSSGSNTTENDNKNYPKSNKNKRPRKTHFTNSLSMSGLASALSTAAAARFPQNNLFNGSSRVPSAEAKKSSQSSNPTVKVLEELTKFQTCLLILSNTVVSLHESLKLVLPGNSATETEPSTMPATSGTVGRVLSYRKTLTPVDLPLDNNNVAKGIVAPTASLPEHLDAIVVSASNSSAATSLDTITTDGSSASIVTACKGDNQYTPRRGSFDSGKESQNYSRFHTICIKLSKYTGLFLALFASICMSLVTLVVKFMERYHPVSKVIWRLQGVVFPSLLILLHVKYYKKEALIVRQDSRTEETNGKTWMLAITLLLVVRGFVGCSADIFQYYSLRHLTLADSTVISFSTPIFVCLVAHYVLKEQCGFVPIFTAIITLCGVIVITRPSFLTGEENMNHDALVGYTLAFLCMIAGTFTTVIMRYLKHVHFAMTMLALGIIGTIEGFVVTLFTSPFQLPQIEDSYHDFALATLTAALFFFGQLAQTLALKHEEAGVVSLVRTCDVLFAFIWQVNLLDQTADNYSIVGAVIVTLGVCITAVRKWVSDLPEHDPLRTKLFFILR